MFCATVGRTAHRERASGAIFAAMRTWVCLNSTMCESRRKSKHALASIPFGFVATRDYHAGAGRGEGSAGQGPAARTGSTLLGNACIGFRLVGRTDEKIDIELYNLRDDPSETRDLSGEHPDIVARIAKVMKEQHIPSKDFPFPALDNQ